MAVAARQLPDPVLRLGVDNLPTGLMPQFVEAVADGHQACATRQAFFESSDVLTVPPQLAPSSRGSSTAGEIPKPVTRRSQSIRRRRECVGCGRRFTTYERVEQTARVIERYGSTRTHGAHYKSGALWLYPERPLIVLG